MLYLLLALILIAALIFLLSPLWLDSSLTARQRLPFVAVVCAFFIIGAAALYASFGSPQTVTAIVQREQQLAQIQADVDRFAELLKNDPQNLEAWLRLAESFMETGQFPAAANSYKRAVIVSKGQPQILVAYARAMILAGGGEVSDDAKKALEMALLQSPDDPLARYFMAVRMLQDGHTNEAMRSMRELYRSLPDDSPVKKMIDRQIGRN